VINKSGVSVSLEEHLPIYLSLNSFIHCRHPVRVSLQPCGYPCIGSVRGSFSAACPCAPCTAVLPPVHPYCPVTVSFDLGSLSVVCLEFARLDASYT